MSGGGGGGGGNGGAGAAGRNHHLQSQLSPLRLPNSNSSALASSESSQHALELHPILLNTSLALSDAGASGWGAGGGGGSANGGSSYNQSSRLNAAGTPSTSTSTHNTIVLPPPPGLPNPAPDLVWRVAARNLALILTWYFFSTCLSLWNRTLLGHGRGVAGRGAFPAPMFMTALQFCVQILMARAALWLGVEGGGGGGNSSSRRSSGSRAGKAVRLPGRRRGAAAAVALPARRWKRLSNSEQPGPEQQQIAGSSSSSSSPPRSSSPLDSSSSPTNSGGEESGNGGGDAGSRLSWRAYFTQVVPNGVCTGLDIGLSNFSLSLISLSFYTMCKSTTPLFLLAFAFAWGIEKCGEARVFFFLLFGFGGREKKEKRECSLEGKLFTRTRTKNSGLPGPSPASSPSFLRG